MNYNFFTSSLALTIFIGNKSLNPDHTQDEGIIYRLGYQEVEMIGVHLRS